MKTNPAKCLLHIHYMMNFIDELYRTITQTYKSDKYISKEQNVMEAVIKNILDDFQWNYQREITIYVLPKFNSRKIL